MTLMLAIGIPVLVIFGGAVLAFSFSSSTEESEGAAVQEATKAKQLVFFQPTGWSSRGKQVPVEEIVANIEQHLRQEHRAASAFASKPSHEALRVD